METSTSVPTTGFDGMVLEISVNGGPFQDILAAGGSFVTGGYNRTISPSFNSPIAGRQAGVAYRPARGRSGVYYDDCQSACGRYRTTRQNSNGGLPLTAALRLRVQSVFVSTRYRYCVYRNGGRCADIRKSTYT